MNKNTLFVLALLSALLFTGIAGTQLVHLGKANPIWHHNVFVGSVAPDENTKLPTISIVSPENKTLHEVDNASFFLNVSVGDSSTAIGCYLLRVYYTTDWQSNDTYIYYNTPPKTFFSETINLTGIPEGNHTLMVHAIETGGYPLYVVNAPNGDTREFAHYLNRFTINSSSMVNFSVDTTPPTISILDIENRTYEASDIALNFTVSEPATKVSYSLDGLDNVTITGNTTLTDLSVVTHNFTVYATDKAGHIGVSETIFFCIEEPFPVVSVATASITLVAVLSAGLVFYFKKRKR